MPLRGSPFRRSPRHQALANVRRHVRWSADHVHAHTQQRPEPDSGPPAGPPPAPLAGRRVRAAIIGIGAIGGGSHLPALARLAEEGETEVVAAVDIDADAVAKFCAEHGIPHGYTDLDRMLAEQRPDLVSVCTPPTLHRDQTIAALRAGAWVWCEKPPVPTLADFDAVEAEEGAETGGRTPRSSSSTASDRVRGTYGS